MENNTESPEQSIGRSLIRNSPTLIAAYLGALAIIAYPLGAFALWVQIWREHTYDASVALHAAALIPMPVAVGTSLSVMGLMIVSSMGPFLIFLALLVSKSVKIGRVGTVLLVLFILSVPSQSFTLPFLLNSLSNSLDLLFYGCFYILSITGSVLVFLLFNKGIIGESGSGDIVNGTILLIMVSIISATLIVPLRQTPLPTVEFGDRSIKEAALVSHEGGYWYIVQNEERTLRAIPDSTAGRVNISEPSQ